MKNYVGLNIADVLPTGTKIDFTESENEYGTMDYLVFTNIFEIESDMWVQGISRICFEVDDSGEITHQIDNT